MGNRAPASGSHHPLNAHCTQQACTELQSLSCTPYSKPTMMLRSFAHSGLLGTGLSCTSSCSRPQRSTALPVLCKNKNRHNKSRGKQQQSPRQRKPKHQSSAWAFPPEPQLTPAEERALGLEFAASSLRRVGNLKGTIEQDSPKGLSNPIMAALFAKAESVTATFQAALDADPDSLTYKEISAVPWFEVSLSLAAGLADVMTHDVALPRIFAARHVFEELALHGSNPTGARDMFLHAPLVARLLSSAVPGFKAFLWLPAGPRYAAAAMQVWAGC